VAVLALVTIVRVSCRSRYEVIPMLYAITVRCPYCKVLCPWAVRAEVEPPPNTPFRVVCPNHGGPIRVLFRYFKPTEALPPDPPVEDYPPVPPKPSPPPEPKPRWWQFWKR
jgi:hypothetical protein